MAVSNAPASRRGYVADYSPYLYVNGVEVARAPVDGCVSSGFGPRVNGGVGKFHNGIDLYTAAPAPIYAGADGVIDAAQTLGGYGKMILMQHGRGVKTRYAHLSLFAPHIRKGERVRKGEIIGYTGATGNASAVHLHYEILVNGKSLDPLGAR